MNPVEPTLGGSADHRGSARPATTSGRLTLDLARYDEQTIRRACVLIHRPSQVINGPTADLCLALAGELDEVLAQRARDTRRMEDELDL